jgi:UDP-MurNAc hydroxylase
MLLKWVNHASFILESGPVRLLCDPWLRGTVFNNGWSLLSPTKMSYEDFSAITHIWFSHEHPDHFCPPNLKQIPEEFRRKILVLFQHTKDKRVVNLCKSLSFRVEELPKHQKVPLAADFSLICGNQDDLDSWSAVFAEGKAILNMNDCVFEWQGELDAVRRAVGDVDVLLSQFSYATWVGNLEDHASHKRYAAQKRAEIARQVRTFQPKWFIPFASFIYFSHAENSYMNETVNRIADVHSFSSRELNIPTIVLYPGDTWEVDTPRDSNDAIQRYECDFDQAMRATPIASLPVELQVLQKAADSFFQKCASKNNQLLLKILPPAVVRLKDLGLDVELSFRRGLTEVQNRQPDIIVSSDSLLNCLTTDWGGETLIINGRFQVPAGGRPRRFFWIFRVPRHNSFGNSFNFGFLCHQILQKARLALSWRKRWEQSAAAPELHGNS